jgi:hypothetical protein
VLSPVGSLVIGEEKQSDGGLRDNQGLCQGKRMRDEASFSKLAAATAEKREERGENAHRNYDERQSVMRR